MEAIRNAEADPSKGIRVETKIEKGRNTYYACVEYDAERKAWHYQVRDNSVKEQGERQLESEHILAQYDTLEAAFGTQFFNVLRDLDATCMDMFMQGLRQRTDTRYEQDNIQVGKRSTHGVFPRSFFYQSVGESYGEMFVPPEAEGERPLYLQVEMFAGDPGRNISDLTIYTISEQTRFLEIKTPDFFVQYPSASAEPTLFRSSSMGCLGEYEYVRKDFEKLERLVQNNFFDVLSVEAAMPNGQGRSPNLIAGRGLRADGQDHHLGNSMGSEFPIAEF